MTLEAFERGDWRAVIDAHPLESHDPAEWLRYGAALLHTLEPGPEQGKQQQQAALAFLQARKEGASEAAVAAEQRRVVGELLREALEMPPLPVPPQPVDERPVIRTLHHFACTGGTVISKCLAAMPGVALVSEVNPLNRSGRAFEPTNPLLLLERSYRPLTLEEIKEDFLGRIVQTLRICTKDGMDLVIRDHSHTDFCMGEAVSDLTPIRSFLVDDYALVSAVTVRHPLDSYLGLLAAGWHSQFSPGSLEEYSRRYLAFLDCYGELPVLRYEEFCLEPEAFMERLCGLLKVGYSASFRERFGGIRLSGDSGRGSTTEIAPRPRRPVPEEVAAEAEQSASYRLLLERLGYPP